MLTADNPRALDDTYAKIAERLKHSHYQVRFVASDAPRAELSITVDFNGVHASTVKSVEFSGPKPPSSAAPPPTFVAGGESALAHSWALYAGAALVLVGLTIGLALALVDREPERRLADEYRLAGVDDSSLEWLTGLAGRASRTASSLLERRGQVRNPR